MANFQDFVKKGTRRYRRIKAGFQNLVDDSGNYTGGKIGVGIQAGTNMSISAPVLSVWRGHPVTELEMKALTESEALDIYYDRYWLPIKGDQINSQLIANFIADMKSSGGGVWSIQKALNNLGESLSVDGSIGPQTLDAINRQIQNSVAKLNNAYLESQDKYYQSISSNYKQQLIDSMYRDYPKMSVTAEKIGVPEGFNNFYIFVGAGVLLLLIIVLLIWMKLKK